MPLRRHFLILLYNFLISGNHSNHVIMNPDIQFKNKVVMYMYLDNIVVKRFIKKFDL